jgi:hypothetical protein
MRGAGGTEGVNINNFRNFWGICRYKTSLNLGLNGRMLLKRIFKNYGGRTWSVLMWLGTFVSRVLNCRVP